MHSNGSCQVRDGGSRILLVAPHGGRRPLVDPANPPSNLRVNDVYTPEVTRLLGERLDAGWIINEHIDRNGLDLNRTTQVLRRAPWFLDLVVEHLTRIIACHGRAEVLFVHGWNVGQAKCDLGIGAVEVDGGLRVSDGARLTVSQAYCESHLEGLRRVAARRGIEVSYGTHYPASHQNNLLQLFTTHDRHPDVPSVGKLCDWARAGVLNAVQLELGIPLRWPGPWSSQWLDVMSEAFGDPVPERTIVPYAVRQVSEDASVSQRAALQFYDSKANLGLLGGIGPMGPDTLGGRLLLFLGGQRVALFTGEDPASHKRGVAPLRIHDDGVTSRLEFDGPLLLMDDAATYLDLEAAFAVSRLAQARVVVEFRGAAGVARPIRFGRVTGTVEIDGKRRLVDCGGFANVATLRMAGAQPYTTLAAAFETGEALFSRQADGDHAALTWHFPVPAAETAMGGELRARVDGDGFTPAELHWRNQEGQVATALPLSCMAILRNVPQGYQRVSFGVARFEWNGSAGFGLYEHAVALTKG